MSPQRLSIEGPAGPLEAVLEGGDNAGGSYAVVCHPHPLYGGTMENKVVTTLTRTFTDLGHPAVRFNFRGVGGSSGAFDNGVGETEDAAAVAAWAAARYAGRSLIVAGFSFGGSIAMRLASIVATAKLVTVAPAVEHLGLYPGKRPSCPWTVVQGDADDLVSPSAVKAWIETLNPAPRLVVLPGVGHFFHGRLQELRDVVTEAVQR